jgi:hypothetical protein
MKCSNIRILDIISSVETVKILPYPVGVKMVNQVFSLEKQDHASNSSQFGRCFLLEMDHSKKKARSELERNASMTLSFKRKILFTILKSNEYYVTSSMSRFPSEILLSFRSVG